MPLETLSGAQIVSKTEEWSELLLPTPEPQPTIEDTDIFRLLKDVMQIRTSVGIADSFERILISGSDLNLQLEYEEYSDGDEIITVIAWKDATDGLEIREVFDFIESHGRDRFKVKIGASYMSPLLGHREGHSRRPTDEVALSMGSRLKIARTVWRAHLTSEPSMINHTQAFLANA